MHPLTYLPVSVGLGSSRVSGGRACVWVGYIWKRRREGGGRKVEEIGGSRRNASRPAEPNFSVVAFGIRATTRMSPSLRVRRPSATFLPFGVDDDVSSIWKEGVGDRRVLNDMSEGEKPRSIWSI